MAEEKNDLGPYVGGSRDAAKEFDSRVFWLAGGAIGLSLTFYQQLIKQSAVVLVSHLLAGWLLLIVAILVVMASFQLVVHSCNAFVLYEQSERTDASAFKRGVALSRAISILNWSSLLLVAIGLVLVCLFFAGNAGFSNKGKGAQSAGAKETRSAATTEAAQDTAHPK